MRAILFILNPHTIFFKANDIFQNFLNYREKLFKKELNSFNDKWETVIKTW
jgi:hypothetical protein